MLTLDDLSKKMPVRLVQKLQQPVDRSLLAQQLMLNGWLDEQLVESLLGKSKECIITIFKTDFGIEAVVSGTPATDTSEQTNFPGFYVARDKNGLTIQKELERAVSYIGEKYMPKMGLLKRKPISYRIADVEPLVGKKRAIVHVTSEPLLDKTEQEYWETYVTPELTVKYHDGRAVRVLAEAYEHHCKSASSMHGPQDAWARGMITHSLYSLLEMMKQHGRKHVSVQEYKTKQGIFAMDNLEFSSFYIPEIRQQIFNGKESVEVPLEIVKKKIQ